MTEENNSEVISETEVVAEPVIAEPVISDPVISEPVSADNTDVQAIATAAASAAVKAQADSTRHTLYLIAKILNWVTLGLAVAATFGFGVIAAAWIIPMTITLNKAEKDGKKHIALGVCTLIFINIISGILILVAGGEDE